MRLDRLKIRSRFKNLSDFSIDFDENSPTTVLVGRNGSGKSNLLEALTIIFRDLDLGERPAFSYELDYVCRGQAIHIDADPDRKAAQGYLVTAEGKQVPFSKVTGDADRQYLPTYVFGYYSGPSNRMEQHFIVHQERFYRDLLAGKEQPLRPLFYARPVHSQFVLLAFFMEQEKEVVDFLDEYLWIEGLDYALFVMHEPSWKSKEGDSRFWFARGVVSDFLDKLYELSLAPLRLKQRIQTAFRKATTSEHLYLYLKDIECVRELAKAYTTRQGFFKALESTYISELISEVRISVKARKVDGSLTFREMSEGEQQLLMLLGLLRFTREDESLFLLDEPDTHLNPAWSVQYIDFLKRIGGAQETSHVIMATHDPLVISALSREQVQILERDEATGKIVTSSPDEHPWKLSISALLTSEVYGLRAALSTKATDYLDRKRELASKNELTDPERDELNKLTELLGGIDATQTVRDPLYKPFVEAMANRQREAGLEEPVLTRNERAELRDLANRALDEAVDHGSTGK